MISALLLPLMVASPQGEGEVGPRLASALPRARIERAQRTIAKWMRREKPLDDAGRTLFENAWHILITDGTGPEALAQTGDLLQIFADVLPHEPPRAGTYRARAGSPKTHRVWVHVTGTPAPASAAAPLAVLVLRGRRGPGKSFESWKNTLRATWGNSTMLDRLRLVSPELRRGEDYDAPADQAEALRIAETIGAFDAFMRKHRYDRRRLILDAGDYAGGFGLRLASYYPDRFAAVIVRRPALYLDRIEALNLNGLPVLVMHDTKTARNATALRAAIEALHPGSTSAVELGTLTQSALQGIVDSFVRRAQRPLFRERFIYAPTHQRREAFWATLVGVPENAVAPFVIAAADRSLNRLEVTVSGASTVQLHINDFLLNLSAPIELVLNGRAKWIHANRGAPLLLMTVRRRWDPTAICTYRVEERVTARRQGSGGPIEAWTGRPATAFVKPGGEVQPRERWQVEMKFRKADPPEPEKDEGETIWHDDPREDEPEVAADPAATAATQPVSAAPDRMRRQVPETWVQLLIGNLEIFLLIFLALALTGTYLFARSRRGPAAS